MLSKYWLTSIIQYYTLSIIKVQTMLTHKESETIRKIRNWMMHYGQSPSRRELMRELGYKSTRSVSIIIDSLIQKGILKKRNSGEIKLVKDPESHDHNAQTINIPLVGVVSCGTPMLAEENIEGFIPVSTSLVRPGSKYYLLRASGDSMNLAGINNGDLVLVQQQQSADDGENVVALIDDEATIKELRRVNGAVVLKPKSSNQEHQPIILTEDFQIQGKIITTIPNFD